MTFEIIRANIVNVAADAVVLPANEKLREGSGASRAIYEAAGRNKLKKACDEIGHCDTGLAVPTPAFDLDAKYIIHAVVPRWKDGNHDEYGLLSSAYLTSMKIADIMGCESIAFPLLASGNNGFDRGLAFKIASESIDSFDGTNLKRVFLVVYNENAECFVRSFGYDVTVIAEVKSIKKPIVADEAKKAILNGLKVATDWLKDKDNQKKILGVGISIALSVIRKDTKKYKIIENLKKLMK